MSFFYIINIDLIAIWQAFVCTSYTMMGRRSIASALMNSRETDKFKDSIMMKIFLFNSKKMFDPSWYYNRSLNILLLMHLSQGFFKIYFNFCLSRKSAPSCAVILSLPNTVESNSMFNIWKRLVNVSVYTHIYNCIHW